MGTIEITNRDIIINKLHMRSESSFNKKNDKKHCKTRNC